MIREEAEETQHSKLVRDVGTEGLAGMVEKVLLPHLHAWENGEEITDPELGLIYSPVLLARFLARRVAEGLPSTAP